MKNEIFEANFLKIKYLLTKGMFAIKLIEYLDYLYLNELYTFSMNNYAKGISNLYNVYVYYII